MSVLLTYDVWPPTRLDHHANLEDMLRQLGEPVKIDRGAYSTRLEWLPIYPGVPIPSCTIAEPWPRESPRRKLLRVSLTQS